MTDPTTGHPRAPEPRAGATTRFAPAPTGYLHLGHVANAIHVWGMAAATGARVLLRVEDHDRQRCRPEYEIALLDDLEWLGLVPDEPSLDSLRSGEASPYRQRDRDALHRTALARLVDEGRAYRCTCTRATFERWAADHGGAWSGPGCPGGCRESAGADRPPDAAQHGIDALLAPGARHGSTVRAWIGDGDEPFDDLLLGLSGGRVAPHGDPVLRDPRGNWSYGFAVVVDDLDQGVDLVVRGRDLLHVTPGQIRLARILGRAAPPRFAHHPLIRKPGGAKLSKADGDTGIRDLRAAGWSAERVLGEAAAAVGLIAAPTTVRITDLADLVRGVDRSARPG
jgi:glutamyl/glutaminyl-tRNA synthetase